MATITRALAETVGTAKTALAIPRAAKAVLVPLGHEVQLIEPDMFS
jgi:hypothetical protein